ncbi:MAG: hypothetical protein EXX96DRAFT_580761 [Benjaminiella poitrasii]|nr:MAG: hypothetical protein EXX96DRAFT_580761 [Benjaminiella poitrasii]
MYGEEEYEEESHYVEFDFGTAVSNEHIETISKEGGCAIIGLEEGKPYLQLGEMMFRGEIDDSLGTHLLFEINEKQQDRSGLVPLLTSMRDDDEQKQQRYTVKYALSTESVIPLESMKLRRKKTQQKAEEKEVEDENGEVYLFDVIGKESNKKQ